MTSLSFYKKRPPKECSSGRALPGNSRYVFTSIQPRSHRSRPHHNGPAGSFLPSGKADFEQINHELAGFSAELADRPQIVVDLLKVRLGVAALTAGDVNDVQ